MVHMSFTGNKRSVRVSNLFFDERFRFPWQSTRKGLSL